MTKHPRQGDLDRLVKAAVKARLSRWQVVLREVNGKVEPVLVVDSANPVETMSGDAAGDWLRENGAS